MWQWFKKDRGWIFTSQSLKELSSHITFIKFESEGSSEDDLIKAT
jgi:hypothetical protein